MATAVNIAWLIPIPGSLVNHTLVVADEGNRYNVYATWNHKYYHLRKYPEGVSVVPHRFVVYLLMVLHEDNVDTLGIEYRQLTTKAVTPRHIQLFRDIWVQRFTFASDPQTQAQDGWHLTIPVWLAVTLLGDIRLLQ